MENSVLQMSGRVESRQQPGYACEGNWLSQDELPAYRPIPKRVVRLRGMDFGVYLPTPFDFEPMLTNSKSAAGRNSAATGNDPSAVIVLIIVSHAKSMTAEHQELPRKQTRTRLSKARW